MLKFFSVYDVVMSESVKIKDEYCKYQYPKITWVLVILTLAEHEAGSIQ